MKKQIVVIHGGDVYETYDKYIEGLKNEEVDLSRLFYKGWKKTLQDKLGPDYQVIAPMMPKKDDARYAEWKIWFEKYIPFINDGVILIGHSLGGIFLAKYLSENTFPKKITATMLVGAPHNEKFEPYLADFILPHNLEQLRNQGGQIFLYFSEDDEVVPIDSLSGYQRDLPDAIVRTFADRGHFIVEEFPEIVADIKSL